MSYQRGRGNPVAELSRSEVEVMKALWRTGAASAREVHEAVGEPRGWSLSTTRTLLERVVAKGAAVRERRHGVWVFRPAVSRAAGLLGLIRDFAERVLEADPEAVVPLLAREADLDPGELEEIERLLAEEGAGDDGDR